MAVKAQKRSGAPTTVDLEALLAEPVKKRAKWVRDRADRKKETESRARSGRPTPKRG